MSRAWWCPTPADCRGIAAAAAAGIIAGDPEAELEVLQGIGEAELEALGRFLDTVPVQVERSGKPYLFDIQVRLFGGGHTAFAEIAGRHTNVIALQRGWTGAGGAPL